MMLDGKSVLCSVSSISNTIISARFLTFAKSEGDIFIFANGTIFTTDITQTDKGTVGHINGQTCLSGSFTASLKVLSERA